MKNFIISVLITCSVLIFIPSSNKVNAGIPVTDAGNISQNATSVIIEGIIKALNQSLEGWENWYMQWIDVFSAELKMQATQALIGNVSSYITTGNNGNPYYVQNWDNYLFYQPRDTVNQRVDSGEFFLEKGITDSGYDAYKQQLFESTKQQLWNDTMDWTPESTATATAGTQDLSTNLLASPDNEFRPLQALLQPTEYPVISQQLLVDDYLDEVQGNVNRRAAEQNDGYLPKKVTSDGVEVTTTPAATHEQMLANALNMGSDVVVNADDPYEFLMGSLTSWIDDTITDGLGPSSIQFSDDFTANEANPNDFVTEVNQNEIDNQTQDAIDLSRSNTYNCNCDRPQNLLCKFRCR